ncbi:MAG: M48 family metallopeptidase, partial [Patescibacteria group bacterium]
MRKGLADYKRYKEPARTAIKSRVEFFTKLYGFTAKRIFVRNQRTRWGSCSRKGNLNFNFRIVYLPREIADYIVVHEICH